MIHEFTIPYLMESRPPEPLGYGLRELPGARQLDHLDTGNTDIISHNDHNGFGNDYFEARSSEHLEEFIEPGFRHLDSALKLWLSNVRIPIKDGYKFLRIKIAGGDKSVQIWKDELSNGRTRLPVASLSRGSHRRDMKRYQPAFHPMSVRYLSSSGEIAAKMFSPAAYEVSYNLSVWAEHKRDIEYVHQWLLTRMNPLAEIIVNTGRAAGKALIAMDDASDASEKETQFGQLAKMKYEYSLKSTAWLSMPELILKTVRGQRSVISEKVI